MIFWFLKSGVIKFAKKTATKVLYLFEIIVKLFSGL